MYIVCVYEPGQNLQPVEEQRSRIDREGSQNLGLGCLLPNDLFLYKRRPI